MRSLRILAMAGAVVLFGGASAAAQQTIFVVRHAERADGGMGVSAMARPAADPELSSAGRERAARLASMLRSADVAHIFTTEFRRARETAAPLAEQLKVTSVALPSGDPGSLVDRIRQVKGNVLTVGHSNTIPDLLKRLGIKNEVVIPETEFDNLFVVVRPVTGDPILIRLRY